MDTMTEDSSDMSHLSEPDSYMDTMTEDSSDMSHLSEPDS